MGASLSITIDVEPLKRVLASLRAPLRQAVMAALVTEAEIVMGQAKEITPVDTGALRASGTVTPHPEEDSVHLSFGNASVRYAWVVHEDLNAHHPVGQAKYLSTPVLAAKDTVTRAVGEATRRVLSGAGG